MPKLLEEVRHLIRTRHYSYRTEEAYLYWIRQYTLFHGKRHPAENGASRSQSIVESWEIGAVVWRVIIGGYGIRTSEGIKVAVSEQAFPVIEGLIKRLTLDGTTHWVRTYYGQLNPKEVTCKEVTCEVLLDNEIWEAAQEQLADLDWPQPEGFYSVRNFLILQRLSMLSEGVIHEQV